MDFIFNAARSKKRTRLALVAGKETRFVESSKGTELRIGYGDKKPLPRRKITLLARRAIAAAKQHKLKSVALNWKEWKAVAGTLSDRSLGEQLAVAMHMAHFEYTTYKTPPKNGFSTLDDISVEGAPAQGRAGINRGSVIGESVNACRALANTPGGDMTPEKLAEVAEASIAGTEAVCEVLDVTDMERLSMGAVLGVGKGSDAPPRFIVMEYWGAGRGKSAPLVLVGKGVTFDTGGLNLKPGDHMYEMHLDMSGGAAVIHAVALAAKLKLKKNVVGLVPAVENMPGNNAFRPGDILRSMSGKTIEVLNTDAEGRVILADALTYAKRYKPKAVIEASTLTGAVLTALGQHCSAILATDQRLADRLIALGEQSGDYLWQLPLWEEYDYITEGIFGDIPNIPAQGNSRYAGVIAGGKFLEKFADGYPFAHLDIAGRMTAAPGEHLAKGAAGAPVRLFLAAIENL